MANTKFDAMVRDPARHRFPQFAGLRVRTAITLVELIDRQPTQVVQVTFAILSFDDSGCLDKDRFLEQQLSLAELAMAPVIAADRSDTDVLDAASRFTAHGGRWTPSRACTVRSRMPHSVEHDVLNCDVLHNTWTCRSHADLQAKDGSARADSRSLPAFGSEEGGCKSSRTISRPGSPSRPCAREARARRVAQTRESGPLRAA